jgi:YNFM family putative membrane transporter
MPDLSSLAAAASGAAAPVRGDGIAGGTAAFRRTNLALFAAGFATFALLYCVQPLMPVFSRQFRVGAAQSSLSLSLTTGVLAAALLVSGSLSQTWGRKPIMVASLVSSAALTVLSAWMPSWYGLLAVRALEGLTLSGLPAVAMAYLAEEMDRAALGLAMGLFIGGSGLGGMAGRLLTGLLADLASWRVAIAAIGVLGLVAGFIVARQLPESVLFQPHPRPAGRLVAPLLDPFRDAGLPWLFLEAFLLMGSFVTIYNYIGYRLLAAPYNLSQAAVGAIFVVYLVGIGSSSWVGVLAGRLGRRRVLWATIVVMTAGVVLTLAAGLPVIIAGLAVMTFGFFGAHSIASSWVGLRARRAAAHATSLYLFFYYLGSSVVGSCGGLFWATYSWRGVAAFITILLLAALLVALRLTRLQPLPAAAATAPLAA